MKKLLEVTVLFLENYILNKSENATHLLLVKMAKKCFLFQFLFCKIKCPTLVTTCTVHVFQAIEAKKIKYL